MYMYIYIVLIFSFFIAALKTDLFTVYMYVAYCKFMIKVYIYMCTNIKVQNICLSFYRSQQMLVEVLAMSMWRPTPELPELLMGGKLGDGAQVIPVSI